MRDLIEQKRIIIEEYLAGQGYSHEKLRLPTVDSDCVQYQWLIKSEDNFSIFLMLFEEDKQSYVWVEVALSKNDSYSPDLTLFMLKTHYSYLHPYRLAISENGFLVVQFISPIRKICDHDFSLLLSDLIGFSKFVFEELKDRFDLKSISFEKGSITKVERNK